MQTTVFRQYLALGACAVILQGCKIESAIDGTVTSTGAPNPSTTLAWSEQATFTPDNRLFIIGGNQPFTYNENGVVVNGASFIYEVKKSTSGKYTNTPVVQGSVNGQTCYFGGLTSVGRVLYATCTNVSSQIPASVLYRVDTSKPASDATRVKTATLSTYAFQPNGIAADKAGDLYIPNSASFIATTYGIPNVPAIVKVKVTDTANFRISETGWLPALLGGFAPNGAAISGNNLYLPSLNVVYRIPILTGGIAGIPVPVYQAPKTNLLDAVTVMGNVITVPEITNPNTAIVQAVYPGTPAATTRTSQVTAIDISTGRFLGAAKFPAHALPSSITASQGSLFPAGSAVVTDAIGAGGLYLIKQ